MNRLTRKRLRVLTAVFAALAVMIANQSWAGPSSSLVIGSAPSVYADTVGSDLSIYAQKGKGKSGGGSGGSGGGSGGSGGGSGGSGGSQQSSTNNSSKENRECGDNNTSNTGSGANTSPGPYDPNCGAASDNGRGGGNATGRPEAGQVGNADFKQPPGQFPGPQDSNAGYECDRNQGIARGNPAHTGCVGPGGGPGGGNGGGNGGGDDDDDDDDDDDGGRRTVTVVQPGQPGPGAAPAPAAQPAPGAVGAAPPAAAPAAAAAAAPAQAPARAAAPAAQVRAAAPAAGAQAQVRRLPSAGGIDPGLLARGLVPVAAVGLIGAGMYLRRRRW